MGWKEKKVDVLIKLMRLGKDTIDFRDDAVFGESQFNVMKILRKKVNVLPTATNDILYIDNYIYLWKGDYVELLTTKERMQKAMNKN